MKKTKVLSKNLKEKDMYSFRSFLILNENRIDFIKNQIKNHDAKNPEKPFLSTEHDPHGKHKTSDDIVDHFSTHADPSPNKEHTQWIINQYRRGHVRQEDTGRIHDTLTNYRIHKNKLDDKDLNSKKYHHIADLDTELEPHLDKPASRKEELRNIKSEGADLVLKDHNGLYMHHIKTESAAKLYGANTKWCTAAEKNNAFSQYSKDLHIINSPVGKFQLHPESGQFMDEKDREITKPKFHELLTKHPILKTNQHIHPFIVKHMPEEIDKLLDGDKEYFPHLHK